MNTEQQEYISLISRSTHDDILIKKTGWEAINFQEHAHEKFQIIYTLSGTLHVETGGVNYFVPEKASHKLSSNSRQVSLIIFYYYCPIKILQSHKIRADFICEVSP
ncbi:hypothetical protein H6A36_09350, partial [Phocaeicola coprocola]|nr:hypothetical protein [Phocaeicola coprocola]